VNNYSIDQDNTDCIKVVTLGEIGKTTVHAIE